METVGSYVHMLLTIWPGQVLRQIQPCFFHQEKGIWITEYKMRLSSFSMNAFHLCLAELVFILFLELQQCCWCPDWHVASCAAVAAALDCEWNSDLNINRACSVMQWLEAGIIRHSSLYEDLKCRWRKHMSFLNSKIDSVVFFCTTLLFFTANAVHTGTAHCLFF